MYLFGELLRVVNKHPTYAAIPPDKDLKLLRASYNSYNHVSFKPYLLIKERISPTA